MRLPRELDRRLQEDGESGNWMGDRTGPGTQETGGELQMLVIFFNKLSTWNRHLAIMGRTGHVATFDWMTGTLHSELQLQETCRDITYARL